jgi:hypothetical protein
MGVEVRWANPEKTAILFVYVHPWSWDDLYVAREMRDFMMDEVDHPVTVIIDLSASKQLPPNVFAGIKKMWEKKHAKSARIILVGTSPLIRSASEVFMRITPGMSSRVRMVATLDDAYSVLSQSHTNQ